MTPPPQFDPATGLPNGRPNFNAPLTNWTTQDTSDSAKECKAQLVSDIELHKQVEAKIRGLHRSEEQELAIEKKSDEDDKVPKGWNHGLRHYGLTAAASAQCIASDDPRLKP
jgi:hypothetical protein